MDQYSYIANAHGAYIDEWYKTYQQDPEAVDFGWRKFFEGFEFSQAYPSENGQETAVAAKAAGAPATADKEIQVFQPIQAYRSGGHLRAQTNPVRPRKDRHALLDLKDFG